MTKSACGLQPTVVASKRTIACVRHGETVWKVEGRTQGRLDSPLTDVGVSQVRELGKRLESENFGTILTSSLGRAIQTSELLSRQLDVEIGLLSDILAERGEGAFQGLTRAQQIALFPECFERKTDKVIPDLIPGVERTAEFLDRATAGLRQIGGFVETWNVLVVTHAGVLQALTSLIFGADFDEVCAKCAFGFCDVIRFDSSQIETSLAESSHDTVDAAAPPTATWPSASRFAGSQPALAAERI